MEGLVVGKKDQGVENAAVISGEAETTLKEACGLLFLDSARVQRELTVKVTYAGTLLLFVKSSLSIMDYLKGYEKVLRY